MLDQCQLKVMGGTGPRPGRPHCQRGRSGGHQGDHHASDILRRSWFVRRAGRSIGPSRLVTFFQSGGTSDQNNIFYVTYEGTPVTVIFVQE